MQTVYPQISYPDGDSPPESGFSVPEEMEIVEYLKIIIPGLRREREIFVLLPTSTRTVIHAEIIVNGVRTGAKWFSSLYNNAEIYWAGEEGYTYSADWQGVVSSPFGPAPQPSQRETISTIGSIGYFEEIEYRPPFMPGHIFWLYNQHIVDGNIGPDVEWILVTTITTNWHIFKQTLTDSDEIVILIPILAALLLPFSFSLSNTHLNDIRRTDKR